YFFFQAEDGIRDFHVTGVQTCALPIYAVDSRAAAPPPGSAGGRPRGDGGPWSEAAGAPNVCAAATSVSDPARDAARRPAPCVELSTVTGDKAAQPAPVLTGPRWFFPSALLHELDPGTDRSGRRPRRTLRDWVVDFGCFLLAVVVGLLGAETLSHSDVPPALIAV